MKYPWAVRGNKVVCIKDEWSPSMPGDVTPVKGQSYTIRDIIDGTEWGYNTIYLTFEELRNKSYPIGGKMIESCFHVIAFRPIQKTDISIFKEILKKVEDKKPVLVD